jgi:hypothetical protein
MRLLTCVMVSLVLFCVGCGGGGGGTGAVNVNEGGGMQTVSFPSSAVTVQKTAGRAAPGEMMTLRLTASGSQPTTVEVLIGADWTMASQQSVAPAGSGIWTANVIYPNPLPAGTTVLVRLTMSDGDIFESSLGDINDAGL